MTGGPLNQGPQPPALVLLPPLVSQPLFPVPLGLGASPRGGAAVGYEVRHLLHAQPFAACPSGPKGWR